MRREEHAKTSSGMIGILAIFIHVCHFSPASYLFLFTSFFFNFLFSNEKVYLDTYF